MGDGDNQISSNSTSLVEAYDRGFRAGKWQGLQEYLCFLRDLYHSLPASGLKDIVEDNLVDVARQRSELSQQDLPCVEHNDQR